MRAFDATRCIRKATRSITPVSPRPPIVARPEWRIFVALDAAARAIRQAQIDPLEMPAEAAGHVVILAVHIVRHPASKRRESRPRCDRRHEALSREGLEQIGEGHARFGHEHARLGVERQKAIEDAS